MSFIHYTWYLQIFGEDVESIYVTELGITMSKDDMFKCLVDDPIEGSIMVDWRDNFPYLKWIPNLYFDKIIKSMCFHRDAVMKSLIQEQQKHTSSRKVHYVTFTTVFLIIYTITPKS